MSTLRRRTPCRGCPFKLRSIPGYLGADRPVPFVAKTWLVELDMPCHQAIDYSDPDWLETQEPGAPMCAGALILMANGHKLPRDQRMAEAVRAVGQSDEVFASVAAFLDHHDPGGAWTPAKAAGAMRQYVLEKEMIDDEYEGASA